MAYTVGHYAKVKMVQLTTEQRTFVVKGYYETGSLQTTHNEFGQGFPDRQPPVHKTIWANVRKSSQDGRILNRNKGNSGRRCTGRSEANIEAVRQRLEEHPTETSAKQNGLGLPVPHFQPNNKAGP